MRSEHGSLLADHPDRDEIPWFIALVLGSYSKKHIFGPSKTVPRLIQERFADFSNRIKWSIVFKDVPSESARPLVKRRVRECRSLMPPAVYAFLNHARPLLVGKFQSRSFAKIEPGFLRFARNWMAKHNLRAELSDKDGVFVLAHDDVVNNLVMSQLVAPKYRPVSPLCLEPAVREVQSGMLRLARIMDGICAPWARELRSFASACTEQNLRCPLLCTVKTHKTPLAARLIHSSTHSIFNAVGGVINHVLEPNLRRKMHVCSSSEEVAARIVGTPVGPRSILLKYDVKDFYLAGEHGFIAEEVSRTVEERSMRRFVREALYLTLTNQFVDQSFSPEFQKHTLFKVETGSGIGMRHAGSTADTLFDRIVEGPLLAEKEALGIQCYLRFRDDVFVVLTDLSTTPTFRSRFEQLASKYCVVSLETFSLVGVSFLDFSIFKSNPNGLGVLMHRPFIKKTARHIALGSDSYHPRSVHESWPVAEMLRMTRRSSSNELAEQWRGIKLARFIHFRLAPHVILKCAEWRAREPSQLAREWLGPSSQDKRTTVRAIIPFRRGLESLATELSGLGEVWRPWLRWETGIDFSFKISWSSGGTPLKGYLKRR